jgi:hypothetical protein
VSPPLLTLRQILLEIQKPVAVIVNEMDKVEVWMHQILAVKTDSFVGIELAYPIVQVRVVIAALGLVVLGPPEVFRWGRFGFRYWWWKWRLLALVLVANWAVVHVFAFATIKRARTTYTHCFSLLLSFPPVGICFGLWLRFR